MGKGRENGVKLEGNPITVAQSGGFEVNHGGSRFFEKYLCRDAGSGELA